MQVLNEGRARCKDIRFCYGPWLSRAVSDLARSTLAPSTPHQARRTKHQAPSTQHSALQLQLLRPTPTLEIRPNTPREVEQKYREFAGVSGPGLAVGGRVRTAYAGSVRCAQDQKGWIRMLLIALLVITGFAFYVMNAEERVRALRPVGRMLRCANRVAMLGGAALRRFFIALLARNRWAFAGVAATAVVVFAAGMHARHLQSLTDIKPELQRLVTIEQQTTRAYEEAIVQFKLGAMSAETLSKMIKRRVMPELRGIRLRLKSLDRIAAEDQRRLGEADEYLQLRFESWRLRAEALEKRSMAALKRADQAELVSLQAFERVRGTELH